MFIIYINLSHIGHIIKVGVNPEILKNRERHNF